MGLLSVVTMGLDKDSQLGAILGTVRLLFGDTWRYLKE